MARKKVKLAFILNDSARRATYNRRKKGLLKKVDELSTLCGIEACAIVYSPYDPQPEVWPSPSGVQNVLSKFRMMPEPEQNKKIFNQETFLKQRILKVKEKVRKQMNENKEQDMTMFMFRCLAAGNIVDDTVSSVDLNALSWVIDKNLRDIDRRMETLEKNALVMAPNQVHVVAPPLPPVPTTIEAMTANEEITLMDATYGLDADTIQRSFFMDLINNDNGDEAIALGDVNLQMGYLPNLLP